ncbi:hypothetical protein N7495_003724 [Penicillium taxi]|uniref:uncharacterized protein n=1 Tax=Penicillium taxi TaxID=168475 RepID=UPI002544E370|nr:uncharacterized protein N7495_003724 [Penicillium taxi]KAJ5898980.1 hypothetical protein N7495_003724 [Penicillium taxi]
MSRVPEGSNDAQALFRYGCLLNWAAQSIYRTLPARFASSTAAPAVTGTVETASMTAIPTATTTGAQSTSTSSSISSKSHSGLTGGDIAGIVIGSIAPVAIIALILIFRRRLMSSFGKGTPAESGSSWSPVYMPPQAQSMAHTDSTWQPSEMSSEHGAVHEMSSATVGQPRSRKPPSLQGSDCVLQSHIEAGMVIVALEPPYAARLKEELLLIKNIEPMFKAKATTPLQRGNQQLTSKFPRKGIALRRKRNIPTEARTYQR